MKVVKTSRDRRQADVRFTRQELEDLWSAVTFTHDKREKITKDKAPGFKRALKRLDKGLCGVVRKLEF